MRYAEVSLHPGLAGFHPAHGQLVTHEYVDRIAIHHLNQLDDGSIVLLYELQGDSESLRKILESHDDVLTFSISPVTEPDRARGQSNTGRVRRSLHLYLHVAPNDLVRSLFGLPQQFSLVIDTPIDCLAGGGIRVRVLGEEPTIARALDQLPDDLDAELLGTGQYHPDGRHLGALLTPKQRDILRTALEAGYYEIPRAVTHEDLADELGLAPGTVGEHLRKIESTVLAEIVPS